MTTMIIIMLNIIIAIVNDTYADFEKMKFELDLYE